MATEFALLRLQTGLSHEEVAEITGYTLRTIYRWENGCTKPKKVVTEQLKALAMKKQHQGNGSSSSPIRFIDLFAGIGGFRKGFETIGGKCVFTSEYNKYSVQTYMANFECDHPVIGDITEVDAEDIPSHDLLLGGFPCQPFSIAGVSKKNSLGRAHGFACDAQGTLFFDVARIIDHHRPAAFLLENVKNLMSHDKGNTFKVIRRVLEEDLGYHISWRIVDGKGFVPQHRERIFIAGFKKDTGFNLADFDFPDPKSGPRLGTILHPEDGTEKPEEPFTEGALGKVNPKYTLTPKLWEYLQNYAEKHRLKGNGFGFGLVGPDDVSRTISARYHKDGSEILIRQKGKRPRRLTPRECARLMGFDSDHQKRMVIPVSDTQAYRQFGNAVVVPVVEQIARYMQPHIEQVIASEAFEKQKKQARVLEPILI